MTELGSGASGAIHLNPEKQRELVERIIASRPFARAPQVRDFLLFIVERAWSDGGASINETEIGRLVLRRQKSDFDPSTDNIVRVQARHLRQKLTEYFEGEGRDEEMVLTIPKGTYVPKFEPREPVAREALDSVVPETVVPGPSRGWSWVVVALVAVPLLIAGGVLGWRAMQRRAAEAQAASQAESHPVWAAFARTGRRTSVILSDSSVSVVQNLLRKPVTLSTYLSPAYPRDVLNGGKEARAMEGLSEITKYPYTSLNSAIVASRLQLSASRAGLETVLRFPRDITIREFESENFVLIGSRRSVPWMELIEDELNFVLAGDPETLDFYMINKSPQSGELPMYRPGKAPDGSPTYGSIALIPNGTGKGLIMCFQGLLGMANEAAEQLVNDSKASPLAPLLRSVPAGSLPHIEMLIRVTGMSGAPLKTEVVATRVRGSSKRSY